MDNSCRYLCKIYPVLFCQPLVEVEYIKPSITISVVALQKNKGRDSRSRKKRPPLRSNLNTDTHERIGIA